jgi:mono/diheme cytochrome c family protein
LSKYFRKLHVLSALASLALLLSACSFSLAEDVPPPPNYTPPAPLETTTVTAASLSYPVVPPDPVKGASIYAEKCAPCHGNSGQSDGARAASLPDPVPAIGSADRARHSNPAAWFNVITNGDLAHFMPPFNGSLSDGQRWDVLAYVYSLSETPEVVAMGGQLYDQNCASCHGVRGKADGPKATGQMTDFTDQASMAQKTTEGLYQAITNGLAPGMPAYNNQFSEIQRRAMADYIRFLSFVPSARAAYPAPGTFLAAAPGAYPVPAATATAANPSGTIAQPSPTLASFSGITSTVAPAVPLGSITGKVINGSGGSLPASMEIALHGFDNMQPVLTDTATIDSSGTYTFNNVGMPVGRVFIASTTYNNTTYSSNVATIDPGTTLLTLDINVYETITDSSSLSVDRLHVFFDFSNPGVVQVIELYLISNPTNKTVVPANPGDAVVTFTLPAGATNLQFQDGALGARYIETPGGFGDTSPVIPGSSQHQVLYGFDLPYTNKLDLRQPVSLPVAAVVVLLPEDGVKIKSNALTDAGTRDVQGTAYHMYNGDKIDPGGTLSLTLSGNPGLVTASPLAIDTRNDLIIGLAALGLVLIVVGVMIYQRTRLRETLPVAASDSFAPLEPKDAQDLIDAIIALDDLYKDGKLPEDAYQQRRADLKAQLKERLGSL